MLTYAQAIAQELTPLIQAGEEADSSKGESSFGVGLVICIISGLFSPCLNLAIAFGRCAYVAYMLHSPALMLLVPLQRLGHRGEGSWEQQDIQ